MPNDDSALVALTAVTPPRGNGHATWLYTNTCNLLEAFLRKEFSGGPDFFSPRKLDECLDVRTYSSHPLIIWIGATRQRRSTIRNSNIVSKEPKIPTLLDFILGREFKNYFSDIRAEPIITFCRIRLRLLYPNWAIFWQLSANDSTSSADDWSW